MSRHYGRTLLLLAPALLDTYRKEGIRGEGPCAESVGGSGPEASDEATASGSLLLCSNYVLLAVASCC